MKIKVTIVITENVDLYDLSEDDLIEITKEQIESGELPVDEFMEHSGNYTVTVERAD